MVDIRNLEARYLSSCRSQDVRPNFSILSSFSKAKLKKSHKQYCNLEISLDRLLHSDFPPLIEALSATKLFGVDAVDLHLESCGTLPNGDDVLALLGVVNEKLQSVNLSMFSKDILRDVSRRGLNCKILNLRYSPIQRLKMTGAFVQLHTLNLDFSCSLTTIKEGCFRYMPNLMCLSMCETRITDLCMTSAALSKLPSLVELRFQNCLCCYDTRPCPASSCKESLHLTCERTSKVPQRSYPHEESSFAVTERLHQSMRYLHDDPFSDDESFLSYEFTPETTDTSDESELEFSDYRQGRGISSGTLSLSLELDRMTNLEITGNRHRYGVSSVSTSALSMSFYPSERQIQLPDNDTELRCEYNTAEPDIVAGLPNMSCNSLLTVEKCCSQVKHQSELHSGGLLMKGEEDRSEDVVSMIPSLDPIPKGFVSHHPSPICFEKNYREFMISSLPRLKVLDNAPITNEERKKSKIIFTQHYEYLPYNKQYKESIVSVLQKREMQGSYLRQSYPSRPSMHSFSRSLAAAKVGSNPWPRSKVLSKFKGVLNEESKSLRPRQFEYHPSEPSLMAFGTLDGELVIINHESSKLVGFLPSAGHLNSILGLCWLRRYPSKLIAGSDNGSLQLYDIRQMPAKIIDKYYRMDATSFSFEKFEQLTSVHVNSTDAQFLASGFSNHVALYDIDSGKRLQVFKDLHREHINVVKFSHHSPSLFATASFDKEVKLWDLRQGTSRSCYTSFSSRGNVMVCFSDDDHYLLSSAVDNEVRQLLAFDGRLHTSFKISPTGSAHNYTRSYYMNGRDYVVSGSCEENVIRICCAQTGRRLRDISLEGRGSKNSTFVQSLRGDPFRAFHMCVLAAYMRPRSKSEIIKVNLVESSKAFEDNSCIRSWKPTYGLGG